MSIILYIIPPTAIEPRIPRAKEWLQKARGMALSKPRPAPLQLPLNIHKLSFAAFFIFSAELLEVWFDGL